jgi:hypothetical protein
MQAASDFLESDFLESDFLESGDTDIWVISVPPTTTIDTICLARRQPALEMIAGAAVADQDRPALLPVAIVERLKLAPGFVIQLDGDAVYQRIMYLMVAR